MNQASLSRPKIGVGYEPFPGYALEEIIGRGGFGEVWRASAPGDLKKAIKFVFGNQDGSRATRELRSLERVKAVRHPFLLTLERFEIVNDQLVIVTELAEGSLEEIYKRHRQSGSCGIPRDVLLKNLLDTADGLDYLHHEYQLQHLDVKPANLLMVGGHVKVADFGLLKDLREVDCSVVGGLTPIYAPPELFDGRPSMHSDQYSLAVMYQEMLTGTRPFAGRTIAQLATQHIHSTPNLEPLPPRDRSVIAKALEKDPSRRFDSCTELLESLRHSRRVSQTGITADDPNANPPAAKPSEVEDLPQIDDAKSESNSSQTSRALVIGIGGTGADCLSEVRRRSASLHLGHPLELTSVLIDTDQATIHAARVGEMSERVPKCHGIHVPLRTPGQYRESGTDRLRTISRRWIYNVPRSGETEGMRPIGRLAMVDHGPQITEGLRNAIKEFQTGAQGDAHVYVVGSITGGTGSGMFIDVIHQLRHLLDEANLHDVKILSLLGTIPIRGETGATLPCHNAHAAMIEMRHFLQAGNGYPGDAGAGFSSVPAARTPLHDVYLVAGNPREKFARSPVQTIVDYVWCSATGAGSLLAKARSKPTPKSESLTLAGATIRTAGIITLGESRSLEQQLLTPAVVYQVLLDWLGTPSAASSISDSIADRISRRIGLTEQYVMGSIIEAISTRNENEDRNVVSERLRAACQDGSLDFISGGLTNQLHREISIALGDRRYSVTALIESLASLNKICQELPDRWAESINPDDENLVSHRKEIVQLARRVLARIGEECSYLRQRMECLAAVLAVSAVDVKKKLVDADPWETMPSKVASGKSGIITLVHQATVNTHLVRPLNDVDSNLDPGSLIEHLTEVALPYIVSWLNQNAEAFEVDSATNTLGSPQATAGTQDFGGTMPLDASMLTPTRTAVDATQQLPTDTASSADATALSVQDAVALVRPHLIDFGGSQRLVLIVGSPGERSQFEPQIRELHNGSLTTKVIEGADPTLVYEAQQISLDAILARLEVLNGETSAITGRLASRIDVSWTR